MITSKGAIQIIDVGTLTGLEAVQKLTDPAVRLEVLSNTLGYAALLLEQSQPSLALLSKDSGLKKSTEETA